MQKNTSMWESLTETKVVIIAIVFLLLLFGTVIGICAGLGSEHSTPPKTVPNAIFASQVGNNGRFGNQMFQVASAIGLGHETGKPVRIYWPEGAAMFDSPIDFSHPIPQEEVPNDTWEQQNCFQYEPIPSKEFNQMDVKGHRQHPAYFAHATHEVRRNFTIKGSIKQQVLKQLPILQTEHCIGLHVRRGDYLKPEHSIHNVCTLNYYLFGIQLFRSMQKDKRKPVIIFSDDINWCFHQFVNAYHINDIILSPFYSPQLDFVALDFCHDKVLSNSTFAYWAAYLDARAGSQVLAPSPWIRGDQWGPSGKEEWRNLYDPSWFVWDVEMERLQQVPDKVAIPLGGYYQCYKQPHAFLEVCKSFRAIYPDTSFVITSDQGDNFEHAAKYFQAKHYQTNPKRNGNGVTTVIHSKDQIMLFLHNFIEGAKSMNEEWFTLLEDDTLHMRAFRANSESISHVDLIGNNASHARLPNPLWELLTSEQQSCTEHQYYGGCGGSLFRTAFWAHLDTTEMSRQMDRYAAVEDKFHSDIVFSFLCLTMGGSICSGQTHFTSELAEIRPRMGISQPPAILHQFKDYYNVPLLEAEKALLQGKEQQS